MARPFLTFEERYPLGYKLCRCKQHVGPRWISVVFFNVAERDELGNARRLQAYCAACQRMSIRRQRGYSPRRPGRLGVKTADHGYAPETAEERAILNANRRERYRKRREREGKKVRERKAPILQANDSSRNGEPTFDAGPIVARLSRAVSEYGMNIVSMHTRTGVSKLQELLDGELSVVPLEFADRVLTGLGYPGDLHLLTERTTNGHHPR